MHPRKTRQFLAWAKHLGIEDLTGLQVKYWVRLVSLAYDRVERDWLVKWGLSGPRSHILLFLYFTEQWEGVSGVSPSQLCTWRGVSKGTMSILLRKLEEDGWIHRERDPANRRRVLVRLTDAARAFIEEHAVPYLRFLNLLVRHLAQEEAEQLVALLQKLYRGMLQEAPDLGLGLAHPFPGSEMDA